MTTSIKLFNPFYGLSGWSGGAKVLGKLSVPGRPTSLDDGRAMAYCACIRCGWVVVWIFFSLVYHFFSFSLSLGGGWSGGAKVLGKLPVPERPTSLDNSRTRAYCACSRCEWGFVWTYFLSSIFSFSLSLGDGPI